MSRSFDHSSDYWEQRYRRSGTSGSGSLGRLARFKADVINDFVAEQDVGSVIELGCGDGNQLSLGRYPQYVGLDVSPAAIEQCRRRFAGDATRHFYLYPGEPIPAEHRTAELALSLDVIYHLVEDEVFDKYMRDLFDAAEKFVIVYSSNEEHPSPFAHVRHRRFTDWIRTHRPQWRLVRSVANPYPSQRLADPDTSYAQFYFFAPVG